MKTLHRYLSISKEILAYAYIWQIPFSWRIIIDPNRSHWGDQFNEYMDISLYLGEILIFMAASILLLEYTLRKKSIELSNRSKETGKMFHVEHQYIFLLTVACLLSLINVFFSIDRLLSLIFLFHLIGFIMFLYILFNIYVPRGTSMLKDIFFILLVSLSIQMCIAMTQVFSGSSIGLGLLNESVLALNQINVAKGHILSELFLRGYGTFPHPNVLGAYGVLCLLYAAAFSNKMFHVEHKIVYVFSAISVITIILTQSKLSMLFLTIIFLNQLYKKYLKNKMFHVEHFIKHVFFAVLIVVLSGVLFFSNDTMQSFKTRIHQYDLQLERINLSLIGSGFGTYRLSYDKPSTDWWNYEPVHFVPILAIAELGILLTTLVLITSISLLRNVPRGTLKYTAILVVFLVYMLSIDHYAWDIYQGNFLVVFTIFIIIARSVKDIDNKKNILHNMYSKSRLNSPLN